jgi:hypothetical protein
MKGMVVAHHTEWGVRREDDENSFGRGGGCSGWLRGIWTGRCANPNQYIWGNVGEGGIRTGGWASRGSRVETEVDGEVFMTLQAPVDGCNSCCLDSGT